MGTTNKTVEVAFTILETLRAMDGARVTELADKLSIAKSTVHRHLSTLEANEYVVKEGDEYNVGLRILRLGDYSRNRKEIHEDIRPIIKKLARETDERAQFLVKEHGYAVYVYQETGTHRVPSPNSGLGRQIPLHVTAAGKAILAELPEAEVWNIIEKKGLKRMSSHSIIDEDELFDELRRIRERGYSTNLGESAEQISAVGVAPTTPEGRPIGGISISGTSYRMKGELLEETIPDLLLGTASEIELDIAYS